MSFFSRYVMTIARVAVFVEGGAGPVVKFLGITSPGVLWSQIDVG